MQNTDFKFIFDNNLDVGVYDGIREYNRNYPEKEDYSLEMLEKIDVLNYAEDVEAEIHFGYSSLDDERNIVIHKKLASLFKRKKVTVFEYEDLNIHEKLMEEWMIN